ncbi:nucleoid occlusion protein [Ligilactobacillus sp. WILCCON 0076]|uniref:Nucleoid occlusion protein n=1 Tax=Ligilactobacillus ubinensis TaxID=2876789 RepID=A0A9X2FKW1_9LACO|nr:nucleoid occlusion protein [Ligilactobacillus ubinensis]MCP0887554.1 nucleoid occlusion protein [Ligilactobacillus ubinensis]
MAFSFFKSKDDKKPQLNEVTEIAVAKIQTNRYQPRKIFNDESIAELATTISEHGLLQPIVVREFLPEQYEIIAGERRFRAVTRLKWEKIPAIVKEMSDVEAASMAVIENMQREELTAIEEARSYKKLMDLNQITQIQLAREIGKSQSFVANKMRLLKLDSTIQNALLNRAISERHGRALISLEPEEQNQVLKKIEEQHLTVKETEAYIAELKAPIEKKVETKIKPKAKPKNKPKGSSKSTKIALNTILQSVKMVSDTGMEIKATEEDGPDYHRIIIDIPLNDKEQK